MLENGICIMTNEEMKAGEHRVPFDCAMEMVTNEMDQILWEAPLLIRTYTAHLMKARGKSIRALCVLSCAMEEDGFLSYNSVIVAAAVEIFHLATLVHDDVMDNGEVRRGIPTLNKKYGRKTAVICGDYLLAKALAQLGKIKEPDRYRNLTSPDYAQRICMGELMQHMNNGNVELSVYRYLSIIRGKTAALFEASFYAGAALSGEEKDRLPCYKRLGNFVGMIFQLTDDCIDFEADEALAGKNVHNDYEQGVITLPLIYTFQKCPSLREQAMTKKLEQQEINHYVQKEGGLLYTKKVAGKYYKKAERLLDGLFIEGEKKERIKAILDKAYYGLKAESNL